MHYSLSSPWIYRVPIRQNKPNAEVEALYHVEKNQVQVPTREIQIRDVLFWREARRKNKDERKRENMKAEPRG